MGNFFVVEEKRVAVCVRVIVPSVAGQMKHVVDMNCAGGRCRHQGRSRRSDSDLDLRARVRGHGVDVGHA